MQRSYALDAYRGLVMLLLVSHGFGFGELRDHPVLGGLAAQFQHVAWEGGVLWDMVQPAFMFIVGAALPFATAIRLQRGQTMGQISKHVAIRSLKLILLSQILMCVAKGELHFQLINVLAQIGLTYFLAFWILRLSWRGQAGAALGLLVFHSALFLLFPGPDGAFSREGNIGAVIDKALLGYNYPGLYVTINFIPSTVTTLIGAWSTQLLLSKRTKLSKVSLLVEAAVVCFLMVFALWALVPCVKRVWTATFTFYSAGWVLLAMLALYFVVDVMGVHRWTFPLRVIGANSIFIYSANMLLGGWLDDALAVFTGRFAFLDEAGAIPQALAVLGVLFYLNYFLYQRRVFIKV